MGSVFYREVSHLVDKQGFYTHMKTNESGIGSETITIRFLSYKNISSISFNLYVRQVTIYPNLNNWKYLIICTLIAIDKIVDWTEKAIVHKP